MSTPDQPEAPQLTRRQLRELRNTASNPVITPEDAAEAAAEAAALENTAVVAPLPRAAEPVVVAEQPPAADEVDLDSPALTRRGARRQERLRTASVPVVGADDAEEEYAAEAPGAEPDAGAPDHHETSDVDAERSDAADAAPSESDSISADAHDEVIVADVDEVSEEELGQAVIADVPGWSAPVAAAAAATGLDELVTAATDAPAEDEERAVVAPTFGSGLLAGEGVEIELPASFDQLLTRGSATVGSSATSNALILSQTPETGSITAPVTATGEVLITGMFNLPESLGSTGTAHGSSDGKDLDALLVDGELPPASSPTPIAASAAISTIKSDDDIIKPPAPEKGSRLMLALGITAGALALALIGVLIVALVTGAIG
ncbi:MAG: hypothetical protein ABS63_04570 [Microbacterium sp. SCN 70-27]|uniref:hypothetical protein n=1 Tax=unclassified Microbacterium TaxID=2609290 RepID=UPI00086F451B|nr:MULTISPECIES: hypothetical protein [unclassified Microbacterium]MBN9223363.1 hypothetical protein [Microbacterium sp.]ODT28315.1 MAG: hypothetical protein ABS63_04570 [Microbacterium sp. SCN 70-27]